MKNLNEVQARIESLTMLVSEIYDLMNNTETTLQQEADAEKVIARVSLQIETLRWVLNN